MNVIVINGPMGIGKTTVGTYIADSNPGTAFIDGDWCMDLHPFVGNKETRDMAVNNILHMISNYKYCSVCKMVVVAWIMDDEQVRENLINGIRDMGLNVKSVTLVSDDEQLRKQWESDVTCPWRTEEWFNVSLKSLKYFSSLDDYINTTGKSVESVADLIMNGID